MGKLRKHQAYLTVFFITAMQLMLWKEHELYPQQACVRSTSDAASELSKSIHPFLILLQLKLKTFLYLLCFFSLSVSYLPKLHSLISLCKWILQCFRTTLLPLCVLHREMTTVYVLDKIVHTYEKGRWWFQYRRAEAWKYHLQSKKWVKPNTTVFKWPKYLFSTTEVCPYLACNRWWNHSQWDQTGAEGLAKCLPARSGLLETVVSVPRDADMELMCCYWVNDIARKWKSGHE